MYAVEMLLETLSIAENGISFKCRDITLAVWVAYDKGPESLQSFIQWVCFEQKLVYNNIIFRERCRWYIFFPSNC